jgi:uncharacterized SAM-binding protein YcdF (DUF218 family)
MNLIYVLLSPMALALLGALALWSMRKLRQRWPVRLVWMAELLLLLSLTPLGANLLVAFVESAAPRADQCLSPAPQAIVVLSGGLDREPAAASDLNSLATSTIRRLVAGSDLYAMTPGATLYLSGGGPFGISESEVMRDLAQRLGIAPSAIHIETTSQNTLENARDLQRISPAPPRRIWLVTSALHLPRALHTFAAAGFDPCGYPADSQYIAPDGPGYLLPQASAAKKSEAALHEIIGTLRDTLRGN